MDRLSSRRKETPSQTAGPYVHIGCTPNFIGIRNVYQRDLGCEMIADRTKGEQIRIFGMVFDGAGTPVRDAVIEIWQADAAGKFPSSQEYRNGPDTGFTGWGRQPVDPDTALYEFRTIRPGAVPFPDGRMQAPHVTFWIVARGINIGLHTRMYFPEMEAENEADPILSRIENRHRVPTLVATPENTDQYRFDIRLQGEGETVFFDV